MVEGCCYMVIGVQDIEAVLSEGIAGESINGVLGGTKEGYRLIEEECKKHKKPVVIEYHNYEQGRCEVMQDGVRVVLRGYISPRNIKGVKTLDNLKAGEIN